MYTVQSQLLIRDDGGFRSVFSSVSNGLMRELHFLASDSILGRDTDSRTDFEKSWLRVLFWDWDCEGEGGGDTESDSAPAQLLCSYEERKVVRNQ